MEPLDRASLRLLLIRAQAGDRGALDAVLRAVQGELSVYLSRYINDRQLAEDTLLIACRQIKWLKQPEFFRSWLYRVATREAWRRLRRERRHRGDAHTDVRDLSDPGRLQPADPAETQKILARIDRLPPNSRAAVLLHYGAGLSLSAAAAVLDVPEGTMKSRLAYALDILRKGDAAP